jgi:hypothetical protein
LAGSDPIQRVADGRSDIYPLLHEHCQWSYGRWNQPTRPQLHAVRSANRVPCPREGAREAGFQFKFKESVVLHAGRHMRARALFWFKTRAGCTALAHASPRSRLDPSLMNGKSRPSAGRRTPLWRGSEPRSRRRRAATR